MLEFKFIVFYMKQKLPLNIKMVSFKNVDVYKLLFETNL
jgi:hypothetical protein